VYRHPACQRVVDLPVGELGFVLFEGDAIGEPPQGGDDDISGGCSVLQPGHLGPPPGIHSTVGVDHGCGSGIGWGTDVTEWAPGDSVAAAGDIPDVPSSTRTTTMPIEIR
jgi:hypothetical protein